MATAKILIAIDPLASEHPAHASLFDMAKRQNMDSAFTLLFAVDPDGTDTRATNADITVDGALIAELEAPFKQNHLCVNSKVSWSHDWAETVLNNAEADRSDFIAVSHPGPDKPQLADNYWKLIRTTNKPLIIINPNRCEKSAKVLMAVDLQDDNIRARNDRILASAKRAAELWDAELHLVNAYNDSLNYPDRGRIVKLSGLPNENVHLVPGEPDLALKQISEKLNPLLLVVGATRRSTGIRAALRGVKVARMFGKVDHDIMVVT